MKGGNGRLLFSLELEEKISRGVINETKPWLFLKFLGTGAKVLNSPKYSRVGYRDCAQFGKEESVILVMGMDLELQHLRIDFIHGNQVGVYVLD